VKRGGVDSEWEDAFALDTAAGRYALADGASASVRAADWAGHLVKGFLSDPFDLADSSALAEWIGRRCAEFTRANPDPNAETMDTGNWVRLASSARHSFATFLGVEFGRGSGQDVTVGWVGVGDCCLLVVRGHHLLWSSPMGPGDSFGTHPDLISSDPDLAARSAGRSFRGRAELAPDDLVLLMSDALAEWALGSAGAGSGSWVQLGQVDDHGFGALIDDLRDHDRIVNDDVTLVRIRVGRPAATGKGS